MYIERRLNAYTKYCYLFPEKNQYQLGGIWKIPLGDSRAYLLVRTFNMIFAKFRNVTRHPSIRKAEVLMGPSICVLQNHVQL